MYLKKNHLISAALLLALLASLAACNNYYIPPPPVQSAIIKAPANGELVITSTNTSNQTIPATFQFQAGVQNTTDTTVQWAIQDPVTFKNIIGGNSTLGTITSTGLYTAPTLLPDPNQITIVDIPQADPTEFSTFVLTLQNPLAQVNSVSPDFVTTGDQTTLTLQGANFYPTTTLQINGGQLGTVTPVNPSQLYPFGEFTATAQFNHPGLAQIQAQNPHSSGNSNSIYMISQPDTPAASSSIAVEMEPVSYTQNSSGTLTPVYANVAFVPQTRQNQIAVVNVDSAQVLTTGGGLPLAISLPTGFAPTAAAANPKNNTVAVISAQTPKLVLINAVNDTVTAVYPIPASGSAKFSDGISCTVCGVTVDSQNNLAILDTASGFLTMNLGTGQTGVPIAAQAAENFSYDPLTQTAYAPYTDASGTGLQVISFANQTVSNFALPQGTAFSLGSALNSAAFDINTNTLLVDDSAASNYTEINWNSPTQSGTQITAPAAQFTPTAGCSGAWNQVNLEPGSHLGLLGNAGSCLAVAVLPGSPPFGAPGVPDTATPSTDTLRWTSLGASPDGAAWLNSPAPQGLTTFSSLDGNVYGLALRADQKMLLRVNLRNFLQQGQIVPSAVDNNQISPSNPTTPTNVDIFDYISLP